VCKLWKRKNPKRKRNVLVAIAKILISLSLINSVELVGLKRRGEENEKKNKENLSNVWTFIFYNRFNFSLFHF